MGSPLADFLRRLPYAAPEGYLPSVALLLAASAQYPEAGDPVLSITSRMLPFTAPDGYFDTLAQNLSVLARVADTGAGEQAPFYTPEGYFEELPERFVKMAKAETAENRPKRRAMQFHMGWKQLRRLAAAAVLVLGVGFGAYRYYHPAMPEAAAARQLAKLDQEDISSYVEQHVDEFDAESLEWATASANPDIPAGISTLDAPEIQDYLQETGETGAAAKPGTL